MEKEPDTHTVWSVSGGVERSQHGKTLRGTVVEEGQRSHPKKEWEGDWESGKAELEAMGCRWVRRVKKSPQ